MVAAPQGSSTTPPQSFEQVRPWVDGCSARRLCSLARVELSGFSASTAKMMARYRSRLRPGLQDRPGWIDRAIRRVMMSLSSQGLPDFLGSLDVHSGLAQLRSEERRVGKGRDGGAAAW